MPDRFALPIDFGFAEGISTTLDKNADGKFEVKQKDVGSGKEIIHSTHDNLDVAYNTAETLVQK